ncbi:uncharacterized protein BCR38DRAFT_338766 [Pseudomassariella vexata]|uniref:Uncharacterized protein n=1 Tax=Pseudomassariella vexata TaxID=1141098 RepID=A0A1Y2E4M3_9PEZI|nr:uncharacterized protein BCR38DRAFT_338766 [Pseudomassariella vexata]ORY65815.1 hypothetical protein BCR38DRAFT_338766 [Pseudomassariella vexata]
MTGNLTSTGRGGAGNISDISNSPRIQPQDLVTPTLKTSVVTTGRGGSGNMAKNTDPVETRARQDVTPVTRRTSENVTHVGRGGAGNVLSPEDSEKARNTGEHSVDEEPKKSADHSLAAKGKGWLFGKKA